MKTAVTDLKRRCFVDRFGRWRGTWRTYMAAKEASDERWQGATAAACAGERLQLIAQRDELTAQVRVSDRRAVKAEEEVMEMRRKLATLRGAATCALGSSAAPPGGPDERILGLERELELERMRALDALPKVRPHTPVISHSSPQQSCYSE